MKKYSIGIDFGTLSARAVLVEVKTGETIASSEFIYPNAVMDKALPDGTILENNSAFQNPQDYLDALKSTVNGVLTKASITADEVAGIGIDFTSCTVLPVDEDGTPLCFYDEFKSEPHAYVKLWKHHSAYKEAEYITEKAIENDEEWIKVYGGTVSSEWLFPKILETLRKAPRVYEKASSFVEAGDWITQLLIGKDVRSSCMAGYKGMFVDDDYPSIDFLEKITPEFKDIVGTKISRNILPAGTKAGELNKLGSELCGLNEGTSVSVPIIDAHAALPAMNITESGKLLMIMGTSTCHIILNDDKIIIPGICGCIKDGIIPGLVAYEAGQAAVGDIFDWFVKNNVPYTYYENSKNEGKNIFEYITEKAEKLGVDENGLVALDWWNGNRTPFVNPSLKGVISGFTLQTKPEEIYRAIVEATAFGTKAIVDLYESYGVSVKEIYATGGISQKNSYIMQVYADVLGKNIIVPKVEQAGAKGTAIFAAYASGEYKSVSEAAENMFNADNIIYYSNNENKEKYSILYDKYKKMTKIFSNS